MRIRNFANESDWRNFEVESWRCAVRERGLKLKFLDPDQQQPFFEALQLPPALRGCRAGRRLWSGVPFAVRRAAIAILIFALGFLARDIAPAATHFTHGLAAFAQAHTAGPDADAGP
jgi:hypothetical protein